MVDIDRFYEMLNEVCEELPDDVSDLTPAGFASDWESPYLVSSLPSAYSTMVRMSNGRIAFYYEEYDDCCAGGFNMVYKELSLEEITSDKYRK